MMQESSDIIKDDKSVGDMKAEAETSKRGTGKRKKKIIMIILLLALAVIEVIVLYGMKKEDIGFSSAIEKNVNKLSSIEAYRQPYSQITRDEWKEIIELEYSNVEQYEPKELKNSELNSLKNEYIGALKECRAVIIESDSKKSSEDFHKNLMEPYIRSCKAIARLGDGDYGIEFSDKEDKAVFRKLKTESWLYDYFLDLKSTPEKKGSKYYTLSVEIENTCGYKIGNCEIDLVLLDSKGKKIGNSSAYVDEWTKGEKREIVFAKIPGSCKSYRINYIQYSL